MSATLLPCPFCGHDSPEFERTGDPGQSCIVICGNCGARHESSDEGAQSGSSWNDRTLPTGWKLVPVKPTIDMLSAMSGEWHPSRHDKARKQYAAMIAATPSAPTAVERKPLFGEMIAQHPGLREEMLAESERAEFEAAYRERYPVTVEIEPHKFCRDDLGMYEDMRVEIAWSMWQARASKGTP